MAPSNKENKYESFTLAELQTECKKRKIEFSSSDDKDELIDLLIMDDNRPTDWGKIYSRLLYHTSLSYEEISHRTIPQIKAILDGAEENISIKMGVPNIFGATSPLPSSTSQDTDGPPKVSQFAAMANMFSGIG